MLRGILRCGVFGHLGVRAACALGGATGLLTVGVLALVARRRAAGVTR